MKKRFEMRMLGRELWVTSDAGDEHVASVIRYVSDKLDEAGRSAGKNPLDVAILVALNIADEYLRIAGATDRIHDKLENRAEELIGLINECR